MMIFQENLVMPFLIRKKKKGIEQIKGNESSEMKLKFISNSFYSGGEGLDYRRKPAPYHHQQISRSVPQHTHMCAAKNYDETH